MDDGPKTHLAARLTEAVETEAPAEEKVVAPVEEEAPVVKFGFKVSDSGEVIIQMNLAKAEQPGSSN